ncbi:MAG: hypothetical protein QM715_09900 [Nibricoccus sp.]
MSTSRQSAFQYLQSVPGALWRWEENGRVLTWKDGTTIAFRDEVDLVIEQLATGGLPSFASIVLLLAACRGKLPSAPENPPRPSTEASHAGLLRVLKTRNFGQALTELAKVSTLPTSLTQTSRGKAFLAETVFETSTSRSKEQAAEIALGLSEEWNDRDLNTPAEDSAPLDLLNSLWTVVEGLRLHTAESLSRRIRTGLDTLPQPAKETIELPPCERMRRVLSHLQQEGEYAGLVLAARDLMAAIRLPSTIAAVDELALGGASGLGNRGSLDRLLLSELAHDNLTLAARVALNEALYVHHEPPALKPERSLTILIDSGLGDPMFHACIARAQFERGFLVLVDSEGFVQLHTMPWGSPRPLAQVQIAIDKLFTAPANKPPALALVNPAVSTDLPAILRVNRFPLYLPVNGKIELIEPTTSGGICVTGDRRLLRWERGTVGATQLLSDLPLGRTVWMHEDTTGRIVVVKGRSGGGHMAVVVLPKDSVQSTVARFTGPQYPLAVFPEGDVLLVILHTRVVVVSLNSAEVLSETSFPPGMSWISGRYFSPGQGITFANWSGNAVHWDETLLGRNTTRQEIALVFERDGAGPWMLLRNGKILSPAGHVFFEVGFSIREARTILKGEVLITIDSSTKANHHAVYLQTKRITPLAGHSAAQAIGRVSPPMRSLQSRFNAIQGAPGQPLRLRKYKGAWLEIHTTAQALRLTQASEKALSLDSSMLRFSTAQTVTQMGCSLQLATWPNGSRAWLDSRGLLHLRSSDSSVPELTLTLNQADMAAWCSDGHICGPEFFVGKDMPVSSEHAATVLKSFCDRLC